MPHCHRTCRVGLLVSALCAPGALAQPCVPHWSGLGVGVNGEVTGLAVFRGRLYAAGTFDRAGGSPAPGLAAWDGGAWSALALPAGGPDPVISVAVGDMGAGERLIVTGFPPLNGTSMALWDGASWTLIQGGPSGSWVGAATVFDAGHGPELYVTGGFACQTATGQTSYIARWNGSVWSGLNGGLGGVVSSYLAGREGAQNVLYVAGGLDAPSAPGTTGLARWNGSVWSSVGGGIQSGDGVALAEYDDGAGPALYVGGQFNWIGNSIPAVNIARWDGGAWSAVPGGADREITSLAVFDDGDGPALFAAGYFQNVGSLPAHRIARYRHGVWTMLDSGLDGSVNKLLAYDPDGPGPAPAVLIAAGAFTSAGGLATPNIAAWVGCPCYANCDASTVAPVLNVNDFLCFQARFAAGSPDANCDRSTTPPVLNVGDFICFQQRLAAGCP